MTTLEKANRFFGGPKGYRALDPALGLRVHPDLMEDAKDVVRDYVTLCYAIEVSGDKPPTWRPIDDAPNVGQFVLAAGRNADGVWWRMTAKYLGKDEAGHDYRGGHGEDVHPLYWMSLPEVPQEGV